MSCLVAADGMRRGRGAREWWLKGDRKIVGKWLIWRFKNLRDRPHERPIFQGFCGPRRTTPAAPRPSPFTSSPSHLALLRQPRHQAPLHAKHTPRPTSKKTSAAIPFDTAAAAKAKHLHMDIFMCVFYQTASAPSSRSRPAPRPRRWPSTSA